MCIPLTTLPQLSALTVSQLALLQLICLADGASGSSDLAPHLLQCSREPLRQAFQVQVQESSLQRGLHQRRALSDRASFQGKEASAAHLGVAALLVTDEHEGDPIHGGQSAHHGRVIQPRPVTVQLYKPAHAIQCSYLA